ncbi:phospholipase D-like domain-containing protein [Leptolyngbya sp. FACHB-16]|uniref:phospholipase D-like domain-containing protein n=1 Tax=unclassified Leptolyngbya TaxID=2650499 RepID=UPI0018F03423
MSQSPLGLNLIEKAVQENYGSSHSVAPLHALQEWLIQLEVCDCQGNIINHQKFETFISQVQGAMWAYADSESTTPKLRLVMTAPNWPGLEEVRQTENVFRDLIYSATKNVWIVNPFFSIDSSQISNLLNLIALRVQQSDVCVRLLVREAEPSGREKVLLSLRRLCGLLSNHQLRRLKAYSLASNKGLTRQTLHAKIIVRDDMEAYVGSANWTESSLTNSIELGLLVEGIIVREQLVPILQTLVEHSEPILLEMF